MTGFVEAIVPDKKLEILKEAIPRIVRVACPCRAETRPAIAAAARKLAMELQDLDALRLQHLDMQQPEHFTQFVEAARLAGAEAIIMPNLPGYGRFLPSVGRLAAENGTPLSALGAPLCKPAACCRTGRRKAKVRSPWLRSSTES
jgi:hypothetical protein